MFLSFDKDNSYHGSIPKNASEIKLEGIFMQKKMESLSPSYKKLGSFRVNCTCKTLLSL